MFEKRGIEDDDPADDGVVREGKLTSKEPERPSWTPRPIKLSRGLGVLLEFQVGHVG